MSIYTARYIYTSKVLNTLMAREEVCLHKSRVKVEVLTEGSHQ